MGTPNREPQKCSRNIREDKDPGRYIPMIFLLYSWGSLFGVLGKLPLPFKSPDNKDCRILVPLGLGVQAGFI